MEDLLRTMLWTSVEEPGTEYLALWADQHGYGARGIYTGVYHGEPVTAAYRLGITTDWRVHRLEATWGVGGWSRSLQLRSEAPGVWSGQAAGPEIQGCTDVDIGWTPFTNTLPIRRLRLAPGESRELTVLYLSPADLAVRPLRQRYTHLGDGRWRYESLASGYTADLTVDRDGLVLDYPGAFRAAATRP